MKKLLTASCAILSLSCGVPAAMAGDLGLAPSSYDWAGGYVGVNAGVSLNTTAVKADYAYVGGADIGADATDLIDDLDYKNTADDLWFTGGMMAGYNWQFGNFVLGGEMDINYIGFDNTASHDASDVMSQVLEPENTTATDRINYTADWFGTVRARLGYAMDNFLVYGTGGLAYGQLKVKQTLSASNDAGESAIWEGEDDGWNFGWTLGAGIEYAVDRWVLGAEYLYVDLGSYDWGSMGNVALNDATLQDDWSNVKQKGEADFTFSVARATLKYRF
ncbi:hypothetical protein DK847_11065 [Aestuariivirga litoralis]|uniref:Porin family protein n=1 Tax=Aestuariivirga litoralis TaxID=2650924 RepID=A0A2W2C9Z4_9HYPH|nr:outer membrane beta-barrel protein [Aestuariivirga litoralis]PZF76983.1 hypothetical protein DK847_11065 [Aestuariivirga litoralis]